MRGKTMYNRYKSKWWDRSRYFGPAVNEDTVYEVVKYKGAPPLYSANSTHMTVLLQHTQL